MAPTVLDSICRGLVGYVSYLAPCGVSPAYSEYLLYEPILRIAKAKGFDVHCEFPVLRAGELGDCKRIDFDLRRPDARLGVEVKWIKNERPDVTNDTDKLAWYSFQYDAPGYVLFFGRNRELENLSPRAETVPLKRGRLVKWCSGKTAYAAQWVRYS